jgi:hypothetical protein
MHLRAKYVNENCHLLPYFDIDHILQQERTW